LKCQIHNKIIVWDKSIIHKCVYYFVKSSSWTNSGNVYFSNEENLFFEVTTSFFDCNITIFNTKEGLFLTANNTDRLEHSHIDFKQFEEFSLSDMDYKYFTLLYTMRTDLFKKFCILLNNILDYHQSLDSKFLK
jgi:hypothetical protein